MSGDVTSRDAGSKRWLRRTVQIIGFGISLGIVVWLVRVATSGDQAKALDQLKEISAGQVAGLIGLSALTLMLNGLLFWIASRPAPWSGKLSLAGILATNAVATMLSYLPFKLSAAARIAVHHRRDGLSLAQMFALFGCFFAAMAGTIGPMALTSIWLGSMDARWLAVCGLGMGVCFVGSVVVARFFAAQREHRWLGRFADAGPWRRVLTPVRVGELHESFAMIGHARWLAAAYVVRVIDMLAQAMRFRVASGAVGGVENALQLGESVVIAAGYFGMLVLSPFGALGAREAGAVGAGALLGSAGDTLAAGEWLAATTLLVTGAEVITLLVLGLVALAWLGPGVLKGTRTTPTSTDESDNAEPPPDEL